MKAEYNVKHQSIEIARDGRSVLTLCDTEGRSVEVVFEDKSIGEVGIKEFQPDGKGGCSIYRPIILRNGDLAFAMIKGSMRLMINLGWLSEGSIGSFGDLVFDNHAYTGNFAVSKRNSLVSIRFDRKEDLLKLQSSIVKVERWSDAWSEITLKNGHVFQGQLHVNLEQALSLGILDLSPENEAKLKTLNTALAAKHLAESTYHAAVLEAGAILHEDGSYEDYRSWYEIPGVPGTW